MSSATREASASVNGASKSLRILFLVSAHNGLSQRAWIALTELGHDVAVAVVGSSAAMEAAVREHDPELIVCPFLKTMIPESIWRSIAAWSCIRVRAATAGRHRWTGRSSWTSRVGSDGAAGQRRVRRRRRVGDAQVPDARGGQERACTGTRSGTPRSRRSSRRSSGSSTAASRAGALAATEPHGDRLRPAADDARRPRDRLERGQHRHGRAQDPRRRGASRACSTRSTAREFHLFGAHRERMLRGRPGEIIAQRTRRDLPRHRRRSGVDHAPQAAATRRPSGTSSCRPRARSRSPASNSTCRRSRCRSTPARQPSTPTARSPTRSTRASVTCTSTSTTAR